MEGPEGIEASWRFVSHALRNAAGVAVHLSKLRPRGTVTKKGKDELVASGPVSFARMYRRLMKCYAWRHLQERCLRVFTSTLGIMT